MFILALDSLDDIQSILAAKPDAVVAGVPPFCARCRAICSFEELEALVSAFHAHGIKVYLNMQAMIEQKNLPAHISAFARAVSCKVDGIYIADDGYIQIAKELSDQTNGTEDYRNLLIVQPETLICSAEDANFFASLNTQAQSLSHELSLNEIEACAKECASLEMLISGRYSWMESRRPLIENYLRHIGRADQFENAKLYELREMNRPGHLPVWQDHLGTHVLGDEIFQAGDDLKGLAEAGLNRYRIDCLLEGNAWGIKMLNAYRHLLDDSHTSTGIKSTIRDTESLIRKEKSNVAY